MTTQTETLVKQEYKEEAEKLNKLLSLVNEKQQERLNSFLDAGIFLAQNHQPNHKHIA